MALEYALHRTGPLTMPPSQLGAFVKSDPARATPNLEFHVQPLSLDKFGEPLHRFPAFTASVCNLRPTSRGHVRIKSARPAGTSRNPAQLPVHAGGPQASPSIRIRLTRRIVNGSQALKQYEPEEFVPGPAFQSEEELVRAAGDIGTTIFHPVGTCRMGRRTTPRRSWTRNCACAASSGCASSTPRSCRASPPATPTRRP